MSDIWWYLGGTGLVALIALFAFWQFTQRKQFLFRQQARAKFQLQREWLEAKFLTLAMENAPRGLQWADCEFDDRVRFARDREKDELCAFVAIEIKFEAIAGGGMEDVEAVGNSKAATSVFHYRGGTWITLGRAIFNLNPHETIVHYQLEHVE
jgi:hypothetical protein